MALITCRDAAFGYEGSTVVAGLNFSVDEGSYLCIVGENGSGKSTLVKGILRLLQPYSGTLEFGDRLQPGQIGYLPQQTPAQRDFPASVREVVLSGCAAGAAWLPFYTRAQKERAAANMALVGVDGLAATCYRELSGGQQQRVLLARALCSTNRLLLLDEPMSGLDPLVTANLYTVIREINRQTGMTVVMVSHDLHSAVQNASHILHLGKKQLFFGPAPEYAATDLGKLFLGGEAHAVPAV